MWPTKPEILTLWPFTENVCQLLPYTILEIKCSRPHSGANACRSEVEVKVMVDLFWVDLTKLVLHFPKVFLAQLCVSADHERPWAREALGMRFGMCMCMYALRRSV